MVCSVRSVEDFVQTANFCLRLWELDFIFRRHSAEEMLFDPHYFDKYPSQTLSGQLEMIEGEAVEVTQLHDQYKRLGRRKTSDPNYENLMCIYDGAKSKLLGEMTKRGVI